MHQQDKPNEREARITALRRQAGDIDAAQALRKIARAILTLARQDVDEAIISTRDENKETS
ncbi:hypothetical protein [Tsukamurella ocularis]|uniref:hypothetical protein n=1 Tax=Tsukamurella ocularis TaxID=1970234 RepID=UPI0039EFFED3